MSAANVIRLRALLSDKFSGLRLRLGEQPPSPNKFWPTGLPILDEPLQGGLPKGALSEIAGAGKNSGAATLMRDLLRRAAQENQIIALIDGNDSLDVTQIEESVLARLLWVRTRSALEALKAADLILRDNNFSLVLIDLKFNSEKELGKIPATTWYRWQRLVEETGRMAVVFAPRPMVTAAQARIILHSCFSLQALERGTEELLRELKLEISEGRSLPEAAGEKVA